MNYNNLKDLSAQEIRTFVSENSDTESFIDSILQDREKMMPLLLQSKAVNDKILNSFLLHEEDCLFICNQLMDNDFTPSLVFVENLINKATVNLDSSLLSLIQKFTSIQLKAEHLFLCLNNELIKTSEFLLLKNPAFSEPRILKNFIKLNTINENVLFLILKSENEENIELLYSQISNTEYGLFLLDFLMTNDFSNFIEWGDEKSSLSYSVSHNNFSALVQKIPLSNQQWEKIAYKVFDSPYSKNPQTVQIVYSPELEEIFDVFKYKQLKFSNEVPKKSLFRLKYIADNPSEASVDELESNLVNEKCPRKIMLYALSDKDLATIKLINLDAIDRVAPSELRDAVLRNSSKDNKEIVKYLLKNTSSKYSKYLREQLSVEEANAIKGKKTSYFSEMLNGFKEENIEEIRKAISYGYSLEQFSKDSFQKSKERDCQYTAINQVILKQLEKEEILTLASSNVSFENISYDDNGNSSSLIPYKFNKKDLLTLKNKIRDEHLFYLAERMEDLVSILTPEEIDNVFDSHFEEILKDAKILKLFIKTKKDKITVNSSSYRKLAQSFNKKDFKQYFEVSYCLYDSFDLVDMNNELIFSIKEILEEIKKDNNLIEKDDVLIAIKERDIELYESILKSYQKGNKELSDVLGFTVKIRRSRLSDFKSKLENINVNPQEILNQLYIDKNKDFYPIERECEKLLIQKEFSKFIKNKTFNISSKINLRDALRALENYPDSRFILACLSIDIDDEDDYNDFMSLKLNNVELESVEIEPTEFLANKDVVDGIFGKIPNNTKKEFSKVDSSSSADFFIFLIENGYEFNEKDSFIRELSEDIKENGYSFELKHVPFYEKCGIIFDTALLTEILNCNHGEEDVINWVISRSGDLSFYTCSEDSFYNKEALDIVKKNKAVVLSDTEFKMISIKKELLESKKITESISISSFSLKEKKELISFIENEVEPEYKKLNLSKDNLEDLNEIKPLSEMISLSMYSDSDLVNVFRISNEISKNKKIIQSLRELILIKGVSFLYKVNELSELFIKKGYEKDIIFSDFIDYSNPKELVFEKTFLEWDSEVIQKLSNMDLYFDSKKSVVRFLNSMKEHDSRYLNDIENMSNRIASELENLKYKLNHNVETEEEKKDLENSINGIEARLQQVKGLDRATDVHDRLVTLAGFIKEDPLQLIGQDKFKDLESESITKEFGYKLSFPKNRAEVQELGKEHGWCVSANSSYADGVVNKKNILVAIAPKDSTNEIQEALALAHFTHKGNNEYSLEQLRWSEKVKKVRNQDASKNFNYSYLINLLESHLKALKGKKNDK